LHRCQHRLAGAGSSPAPLAGQARLPSARRFPAHPDPRWKAFFSSLVKQRPALRHVSEDILRHAMAVDDVRPDAFEHIVTCDNRKPVAA
jgi:hypothetical protein